jgi:hypothetical protein
MANEPDQKKPSSKSGDTANKAKPAAKPGGAEKAQDKPGFTKKVSDLNLED